jgi:hypothetical protein
VIALTDIQQHSCDLLRAHSAFAFTRPEGFEGEIVVVDDGRATSAEADALRQVGYFAAVLPPMRATKLSSTASSTGAGGKVQVAVSLWVYVAVNPDKSRVNPLTLVQGAKDALLAYEGVVKNPNDRYKMGETPFLLDDSDPSVTAYLLFFEKQCVM